MVDILLVDDEPRMLELLTLYLTQSDITAYVQYQGRSYFTYRKSKLQICFTRYYDAKDGWVGNVQKNSII